jgi:peptidoglycan/LPS O-acetylase OafA/YrhL
MTDINKISTMAWLDGLKGFAFIWIFIDHFVEQIFGAASIANPRLEWPPLTEKISELIPLTGYGVWDLPLNFLRYFGWFGDQGVPLFLLISGFGLTWGLLHKEQANSIPDIPFYERRFERIYPIWWGVIFFFMLTWIFSGWGLSFSDLKTYLNFLGLKFLPGMNSFSPSWWYVSLIIQLYLIYPILWRYLKRVGPFKLLIITCVISFIIRAIGIYILKDKHFVDAWCRGSIFITRLPEFTLGISLAVWFFEKPDKTDQKLRSTLMLMTGLILYVIGTILSLFWFGMVIAPFLLLCGGFILLYPIFKSLMDQKNLLSQPFKWIGHHSYSFYLMHQPFILLLVLPGIGSFVDTTGRILLAALITVLSSLAIEYVVKIIESKFLNKKKNVKYL